MTPVPPTPASRMRQVSPPADTAGGGSESVFRGDSFRGVAPSNLFKAHVSPSVDGDTVTLACSKALVFSNYLQLKRRVLDTTQKVVVLDLADTTLVDHTVLEKLPDLAGELAAQGRKLITLGLDEHVSFTGHATAARISRASIRPPA